ncbi:MAG: hypothetical protein MUE62_07775 [Burkholderiaceae bacterium]|nr:hypothetical protein [Burkholderiaceae bacterium]
MTLPAPRLAATRWALLAGNFAIGCGVMVTAGSLNDLVRSLQVSVAVGGQLISVAAVVMAIGAPLLAAVVGGWDRRVLLVAALVWYALGHAASALMPHFAALLPVRSRSSSSAGRSPRWSGCRCTPTSAKPSAGAGRSHSWPCSPPAVPGGCGARCLPA